MLTRQCRPWLAVPLLAVFWTDPRLPNPRIKRETRSCKAPVIRHHVGGWPFGWSPQGRFDAMYTLRTETANNSEKNVAQLNELKQWIR
jgi:hypothetical protein